MLRIGQVEATATQDGKYTEGSVAGGIAATRLRAAAFNAMQEELAHIVESAGLALDINDMTQVLKAIQKLTLSRANPFADIKSDGAAAISTALTNLGFGSFPQYQNLGVGQHIIQHGSGSTNSSGIVDIVFPKAFTTTDNLNVIATATAITPSNYIITVGEPTLTGVRIYATGANAGAIPAAAFSIGFNWFATGR